MSDALGAPLIACVAFVAASSELLYFKSFVSDEQIKLQLAVFTSLDFVEEKSACVNSGRNRLALRVRVRGGNIVSRTSFLLQLENGVPE